MNENFRNVLIRDLIRETKADYWKLYKLDNVTLLKIYELLVPKDKQECSIKDLKKEELSKIQAGIFNI